MFGTTGNGNECKMDSFEFLVLMCQKVQVISNLIDRNIDELYIPDDTTTVGEYACAGCSKLTAVFVPFRVETIAANAFTGCSGVTFTIDKPENSISGFPWGATKSTINWKT